jgi:hypothetical protein
MRFAYGRREAMPKTLAGQVIFFDGRHRPQSRTPRRRTTCGSERQGERRRLDRGLCRMVCTRAAGPAKARGFAPPWRDIVSYHDVTGTMTEDASDIVLVDLRPRRRARRPPLPQPKKPHGSRRDSSTAP